MADEVKSIDTRTNEGFARVGAEFKSVRAEIVAGGQATSADKVSYGDKTVQQALDDLNYKAIAINSFTNDVGTVEMGSTVTDVTLSYSFNKTAKSLTLDGTAIDVASTKQVLTGLTITANKTYTLTATTIETPKPLRPRQSAFSMAATTVWAQLTLMALIKHSSQALRRYFRAHVPARSMSQLEKVSLSTTPFLIVLARHRLRLVGLKVVLVCLRPSTTKIRQAIPSPTTSTSRRMRILAQRRLSLLN